MDFEKFIEIVLFDFQFDILIFDCVFPENILMVNNTDDADIKLVDFGLSKTFGPGETCKEPFGTLCYVAPEILL